MAYEHIERTDHGEGIVRLSQDRPGKRNAQNHELLEELDEAVREVEAEDDSRVLIIDGNGPHFSVGHALGKDVIENRVENWAMEDFLELEQELYFDACLRLQELDLPTIAQVHGYCGAGGMMLAAMCDLMVVAEDATFENPTYQMAAAGGEIFYEPWELGLRKAKELLWTGDSLSGTEAADLGLANRAVPESELAEETMVMATKIARLPPFAVQLSLRSFRFMANQMGRRAAYEYHMLIHQMQHVSQEYTDQRKEAVDLIEKHGMDGWLERRRSKFDIDRDSISLD
jgi:enoyl-CoA hydratase